MPEAPEQNIPRGLLASLLACLAVYLVMFGTGRLIFREWLSGLIFIVAALIFAVLTARVWKRGSGAAAGGR